MLKICKKCKVEKNLEDFGMNNRKEDLHQDYCKSCVSLYTKGNPKSKKSKREWYHRNKLKNRKKFMKSSIKSSKKRYQNDSLFRLSQNVRVNIRGKFKRKKLSYNKFTKDILGCTFEEFKVYIESLWEPWMNWENYGNWDGIATKSNHSWDLDHIIPISTAKTKEDLLKLNHFSNFQPMCSYKNR